MSNRDEYVRKMQAKLQEWNEEIDVLTEKASEAASELRQEYGEQIDALKAKQAAARQRIEELQQAGEGAWDDVKAGFELARTAMGEALDSARKRFK